MNSDVGELPGFSPDASKFAWLPVALLLVPFYETLSSIRFALNVFTQVPSPKTSFPTVVLKMRIFVPSISKNCAPEAWIATSLYANYYFDAAIMEHTVAAHGGTHYLGITAGSLGMLGIRNFVRSRLLCGMQEGHQYKLVMYLHAESPILDSIGIYFLNRIT